MKMAQRFNQLQFENGKFGRLTNSNFNINLKFKNNEKKWRTNFIFLGI